VKRTLILLSALAAVLVLGTGSAQARGGALDPGFGADGRVLGGADWWNGVALGPNGEIAAAGAVFGGRNNPAYFPAVAVFQANGVQKFAWVDQSVPFGYPNAVAVQPDGKVVAAGCIWSYAEGEVRTEFFLARFAVDGTPDTTFGTGGLVTTGIGDTGEARAVLLQPDGKIVAVGSTGGEECYLQHSGIPEFTLARYNPDGSLDPTFGNAGIARTSFGGFDYAKAAVLQPDGKIIAGGFTGTFRPDGTSTPSLALARFQPDGSLDPSFGAEGKVLGDFGQINALALQPDGKLVAAGLGLYTGSHPDGALLARFQSDGRLDPQFGAYGFVSPGLSGSATGVAIAPDRKIVAAAGSVVLRLTSAGLPDSTFGKEAGMPPGAVTIPRFRGGPVVVQADGNIVSAGSARTSELVRLLAARSKLLAIRRLGRGKGTVLSAPANIWCGKRLKHSVRFPPLRVCSALFEEGSTVRVSLTNLQGSRVRWKGACRGRRAFCDVQMNDDRHITVLLEPRRR
jgi:uncharacterized delta-60 repeat protein